MRKITMTKIDPLWHLGVSTKERRFFGPGGRIHMPGAMMTKAGKRMQMQKDANRASPRRGRRRK